MQKSIVLFTLCLLFIWACKESGSRSGDNRKKDSISKVVQDAARDIAGNFSEQSSLRFSANRIDYSVINTSSPLDHALFSYLTTRERLTRVR